MKLVIFLFFLVLAAYVAIFTGNILLQVTNALQPLLSVIK